MNDQDNQGNLNKNNNSPSLKQSDPEKYAYLMSEAQAPYRGLRRFIYVGFGASGAIGAFIFFTQILAGKGVEDNLLNLLVQLGVIGLMVFLFKWDRKKDN
ncbi:DUF3493 domain-containing protein [Cyanobacterium stanieri LEGE 03274]|uniref:DUF3493 domain-containing protein n=1 Tax=Cyanobacterium stanieri LEGE 03274 TaxID=1828756 RepID=A0ABR9V4I6_9CHRO|nr:DUF3493 domain-containing protein [Cyanobacterium stanieri]MBE9222792.1 DUF3493 domain-containing protein [Cyanobacterium stanieri LEGE 03274]